MTNRAERRRQASCHHDWVAKEWPDGVGMRLCRVCRREEWHDSPTKFRPDAHASGAS